ncbi:hypothetical protein TVAG_093440 [Trichomonas vaginalis G3]|uniref:Spindle assembly abnormal protein 6 N-terminal domain-containing protein n=1 Tax=Trichomonas vaginalis (strain ATCC PRA-98 / G3) TaxID=412133 RepID=A2DBG7_TRIV3|nr:assembly abnormal protein 6-related family [Trichomonas vaginalis G3]EAY22170.1 hypothetical protein TVAG_093440 [Trichomonas vaginalis G3]KAI5533372.1 assembly abnormal protein 6-related family [Trichomonas vaginalis G3]|eukprot:XP_001583156.1 hypothetical protein [Trichomonas vaginalis G3]
MDTDDSKLHPLLRAEEGQEPEFINDGEFEITCGTPEGDQQFSLQIFYTQHEESQLERIRLELTKEEDIFYIATVTIDQEAFNQNFAKTFKGDFSQFPVKIKQLIQNVQTNRTVFTAFFEENTLTIKQKLQFKTVRILELKFELLQPDDDYVVDVAQFRYDKKKTLTEALEASYDQLCKHVQKQNKQLYQQLVRGQDFNASRSLR